jgi:streptogramin lyase
MMSLAVEPAHSDARLPTRRPRAGIPGLFATLVVAIVLVASAFGSSTALAAEGDILVLDGDSGNATVVRVDRASGAETLLLPTGSLSGAVALDVEVSGDIFVLENCCDDRGRIVRIDPTTGQQTVVTEKQVINDAADLAIEPSGPLLSTEKFCCSTADRANGAGIVRTDPISGDQSLVSTNDWLIAHTDMRIAVTSDGTIYVLAPTQSSGTSSLRLIQIDPSTGRQTTVASGAVLTDASDITASPGGDLFISAGSQATARILRFQRASGTITQIASRGSLTQPFRLVVAPTGEIVVVDFQCCSGTLRLILIDPAAGSQRILATLQRVRRPQGVAIEGVQRSFSAPRANSERYDIAYDGALTTAAPGILANDQPQSGSLSSTLVRGPSNGTLELKSDGGFTYKPESGFVGYDSFVYLVRNQSGAGNPAVVLLQVHDPPPSAGEALVAGDDCCGRAAVVRIDLTTGRQVLVSRGKVFQGQPTGIAVLPTGEIVVSDPRCCDERGGLVGIDPRTGVQRIVSRAGGQFIRGVVVTPTKELVILRQNPSQLLRIDPTTGEATEIARVTGIVLGLTVDRDGTFLVTRSRNNSPDGRAGVVRVDPATRRQTTVASGGLLDAPFDLTVMPDGGIVVVDGERLIRIDPATGTQRIVSQRGRLRFVGNVTVGPRSELLVVGRCCERDNIGLFQIDPSNGSQSVVANGGDLGGPNALTIVPASPEVAASAPTVDPGPRPSVDDSDKPKRETETERRQRERTNRLGLDDYHTEGNVVEVHLDEDPPFVVIGTRDGLVNVELACGASCPTIRVGDYLNAEGEKIHEGRFIATDLDVE